MDRLELMAGPSCSKKPSGITRDLNASWIIGLSMKGTSCIISRTRDEYCSRGMGARPV
jgi:hypothetical protein